MMFSFTFIRPAIRDNYPSIVFLGQILPDSALVTKKRDNHATKKVLIDNIKLALPGKKESNRLPNSQYYTKSLLPLILDENKIAGPRKADFQTYLPLKKESVLMFYPSLPMQFVLYFNDRQTVHLELLFNISTSGKANPILIKRKISSGNLDVDLLAMRYIGRYLFIQQNKFPKDTWQSIKIDLSAKSN
jgi:hypothetical protein